MGARTPIHLRFFAIARYLLKRPAVRIAWRLCAHCDVVSCRPISRTFSSGSTTSETRARGRIHHQRSWTVGSSFVDGAPAPLFNQPCAPSSARTWHTPSPTLWFTPFAHSLSHSPVVLSSLSGSSGSLWLFWLSCPCDSPATLLPCPVAFPLSCFLPHLPIRFHSFLSGLALLLSFFSQAHFPSLPFVPSPHRPHLSDKLQGVVVRPFRFSTAPFVRSSPTSRAVPSFRSCPADFKDLWRSRAQQMPAYD